MIEKFHKICDDRHQTVSIFKVKGSNEILGGYNPIKWKRASDYDRTKDSFIFSFKNGIENYILSRVKNVSFAIYNGPRYGPTFDDDLTIYCDNFMVYTNYCRRKSYEKQIRETETSFSVEEYEVFQIIKKLIF